MMAETQIQRIGCENLRLHHYWYNAKLDANADTNINVEVDNIYIIFFLQVICGNVNTSLSNVISIIQNILLMEFDCHREIFIE